jgi:hypothetical protein
MIDFMTYDSRPDTYLHALRVGELMMQVLTDALNRTLQHDISKTRPPELEVFDRVTPQLKELEYGTEEYAEALRDMGPALQHHYKANRHHPEYFTDGVSGMTLVDLIEMLADWKAATERMESGSLLKSLPIQRDRFQLSDVDLYDILINTAQYYGYITNENARELRKI